MGASAGKPGDLAPLAAYAAKRDFYRTPEPAPLPYALGAGPLLFVVQQHAGRRLHWDLRLEAGGVLLSWALPAGPSLVAGERRLAVRTEDHPLAYAAFEGAIPKREYGAGEVIVWDAGAYSPEESGRIAEADRVAAEARIMDAIARGKLDVFLRGHKLKGRFALVRTKSTHNWLLIKHDDRFARADVPGVEADRSVLSGMTLEDMRREGGPATRVAPEHVVPRGPSSPMPARFGPMLATPVDAPFDGPEWMFEPKLDGYRALAYIASGKVRLHSRRGGLDLDTAFPEIRAELVAQGVDTMILDAELVAFDADGRPSFHVLQNRAPGGRDARSRARAAAPDAHCILYCFDLLHFAGIDLRERRYADRRRYLEQCLLPSAHLQIVHAEADGLALYRAAIASGFEGSVAKRRDSRYEPGVRSRHWLKAKRVATADYAVGGYTRGKGGRAAQFGALLLGEPLPGGKLRYVGRVGSGFDDASLQELKQRFAALETRTMPFVERPPDIGPATWIEPALIAEVRYAEITPQGLLRAPVFVRLREDKPMRAVKRSSTRTRRDGAEPREAGAPTGRVERDLGTRDIAGVVDQLHAKAARMTLQVCDQSIALTNLDKVLWPEERALAQVPCTKRDFLVYLAKVSPYMLPHLADRPLTMIRMPDGIHGERFFQKHWDHPLPPFVETIDVFSESKDESHTYLLCNNLPTLLWLGQIGTLELHVWHSRANTSPEAEGAGTDYASSLDALESSILNYPDYIVFDLDPYIYSGKEKQGAEPELNDAAFERVREVAFHLRDVMRAMALEPIVKTSGKTGLHVFLPIVRTIDFDAARAVCEAIGRHLMAQHPQSITMEWSTRKRTGKIFFDHNMNARAKTLNVAYSPRGVAGTPVSMPLSWEELAQAHPLDFRMNNVIPRLEAHGDRWRHALDAKQDLTRSLELSVRNGENSEKQRKGRRR